MQSFVWGAAIWVAMLSGAASSPVLAPGTEPTVRQTVAAAAQAGGIRRARVFADQSFRVAAAGSILTGQGFTDQPNGGENATCFVALAAAGAPVRVVATVGRDEWEAETCLGIAAVGVIDTTGDIVRLAVIHRAASPSGTAMEPVVIHWDTRRAQISADVPDYRRASVAGAVTVRAVRAALNATPRKP